MSVQNSSSEQSPRLPSRQEIIDHLRRTNFIADEPGQENFYARAIEELAEGKPAKAITILEKEREKARATAQARTSPLYQEPTKKRDDQIIHEAQGAALLTSYIEFLNTID